MARDRINLESIRDAGIRRALAAAQRDGRLKDAEVETIIRAALADQADGRRLDDQEVADLLMIAKQSVTMSPRARNRIRQTILTEYTRHRIRDREMGRALRRALADGVLTRAELEEVVQGALDREQNAQGRNVILSPVEINDLLLLSKSVSDEFRRYILRVLLNHVPAQQPPVTKPTSKLLEMACRDKGGEYKVPVVILRDSTPTISADALPESDAEHDMTTVTYGSPAGKGEGATRLVSQSGGASYTHAGDRVLNVGRWPRVRRIMIRIEYGLGARSDAKVGYGRGTTDDDIRFGRVTMGFHEDCHRQVLTHFLRSNRLPQFGGDVGQSVNVFKKHCETYKEAVDKYFKGADKESGRLVDEVGYRRTEWLRHKF